MIAFQRKCPIPRSKRSPLQGGVNAVYYSNSTSVKRQKTIGIRTEATPPSAVGKDWAATDGIGVIRGT